MMYLAALLLAGGLGLAAGTASVREQRPSLSSCRCDCGGPCLAGGSAECGVLQGRAPKPDAGRCNQSRPMDSLPSNGTYPTKSCRHYVQYWVQVAGGPSSPEVLYPSERNVRLTAVAVPTTRMPADGWPYVMYTMFMTSDGISAGWPLDRPAEDGILEEKLRSQTFPQIQHVLHSLLQAGIAVIMTSQWKYDLDFFVPGAPDDGGLCNVSHPSYSCWNNGDNPDAGYFRKLFSLVRSNSLLPDLSPGLRFDYNRMSIMGYSAGAHLCSRLVNEFPGMTTLDGAPMPEIASVVLIAGGSYFCYSYDNVVPPNSYLPCVDEKKGCCPHNQTESHYDEGLYPWFSHPPVLLIQSDQDCCGDPQASNYYFDILARNGAPVFKVIDRGDNHGINNCQIDPTVSFLLHYLVEELRLPEKSIPSSHLSGFACAAMATLLIGTIIASRSRRKAADISSVKPLLEHDSCTL